MNIDKEKPFIFTLSDYSVFPTKTKHYLKEPNKDASVISQDKWFELYDSGIQVAPPLSINL